MTTSWSMAQPPLISAWVTAPAPAPSSSTGPPPSIAASSVACARRRAVHGLLGMGNPTATGSRDQPRRKGREVLGIGPAGFACQRRNDAVGCRFVSTRCLGQDIHLLPDLVDRHL